MITLKSQYPFIDVNGNEKTNLIKYYAEDEFGYKYYITQNETGTIYSEAIDLYPSSYTYTVTDRKVLDAKKTISNPNLIHNSQFLLNLRGNTIYDIQTIEKTSVDRWRKSPNVIVEVLEDVGISITNTDTTKPYGIMQWIFDTDLILGKQLTITIQTPDNKYVYTTDALPTSMKKTFYTVQQIDTEFGYVSIYCGNEHFRIMIAVNQTAEGETPVPFIINWVKVETGTESTPFEPMPYNELLMLGRHFYAPALNDMLNVGYAKITSTKTECFFPCPIVNELFIQPQIATGSLEGQISFGGEALRDVTFSKIQSGGRNKDYSFQVVKCTITEDNTEKLNGATELYETCIGKYTDVYFDGELAR